jgi:phosphoribosylformylglycinamidine (FGAM) synthase-like enzyme
MARLFLTEDTAEKNPLLVNVVAVGLCKKKKLSTLPAPESRKQAHSAGSSTGKEGWGASRCFKSLSGSVKPETAERPVGDPYTKKLVMK